jgi:hypothetical protein
MSGHRCEFIVYSSPVKFAATRSNKKKGLTGQADLSIFNGVNIVHRERMKTEKRHKNGRWEGERVDG